MDRFTYFVTDRKKTVLIIFAALAVIFGAMIPAVVVNHDLAGYLPPDAPSTKAIDVMEREFPDAVPNAQLTVPDVTVAQAQTLKAELKKAPGVAEVLWLDDVYDTSRPLGYGDPDTIEEFYKDGAATYTVTVEEGRATEADEAVRKLTGGAGLTGDAMRSAALVDATSSEVGGALMILLPIIFAILFLSTSSWIEPLYFILVIGVSIVINMGTNIFLGDVSFITYAVSPILQLACSLDYAIFLLHSFEDNRRHHEDPVTAMRHALRQSMPVVGASAVTTIFGFFALNFMNFRIGADLGVNLMKGIALSFASVMILLPAFTLLTYRLIDRTTHRPLMPQFKRIGRAATLVAVPVIALVAVAALPCFLGQSKTEFTYNYDTEENAAADMQEDTIVLLVPRGAPANEAALSDALAGDAAVTGVVSYASEVGAWIPPGYLGADITDSFYSENYARIIAYTDTGVEGAAAFGTVERVNEIAARYYGEEAMLLGQSVNTWDMRNLVSRDNIAVSLIAIISIFFVLLIVFRSAILPLILLITIESAIWINLAIPYFEGISINFLGYLVLSSVQLGCTVDYAILLTNTYLRHRRKAPARAAVRGALGECFRSILVSASVLAAAGLTLYATSTTSAVSEIGLLLGRGTLLSLMMVTFFLPAMLMLCDRPIARLTYKPQFYTEQRL